MLLFIDMLFVHCVKGYGAGKLKLNLSIKSYTWHDEWKSYRTVKWNAQPIIYGCSPPNSTDLCHPLIKPAQSLTSYNIRSLLFATTTEGKGGKGTIRREHTGMPAIPVYFILFSNLILVNLERFLSNATSGIFTSGIFTSVPFAHPLYPSMHS